MVAPRSASEPITSTTTTRWRQYRPRSSARWSATRLTGCFSAPARRHTLLRSAPRLRRPRDREGLHHGELAHGMSQSYTASDIEVLSGLEPVRRRPGMYTHTQRPNHLAHEVIDNSVDEAIAGYCKQIDVVLCKDNSLEVADDGRGMPVDIHPKEKV